MLQLIQEQCNKKVTFSVGSGYAQDSASGSASSSGQPSFSVGQFARVSRTASSPPEGYAAENYLCSYSVGSRVFFLNLAMHNNVVHARVWQSATNHGGSCRSGTARSCPRITENCLPRGYGIWQGIGLALKHSLPTSSEICVMLHTGNCWIGWQYKHWPFPSSWILVSISRFPIRLGLQ